MAGPLNAILANRFCNVDKFNSGSLLRDHNNQNPPFTSTTSKPVRCKYLVVVNGESTNFCCGDGCRLGKEGCSIHGTAKKKSGNKLRLKK